MAGIGVFDSGIGGLTVACEIARALPGRDLVYLGDTARLPYGAKSPSTVIRYATRCVGFLAEAGVDAIVVACNTASAFALAALREAYPNLPVLGVVEPGARSAVGATSRGAVGVIGTEGTVRSGSYGRAIHALRPEAVVTQLACPLLVPLAEAGWLDHPVTRLTLETYLAPLVHGNAPVDTLVLACTHYPVLKPAIRAVLAKLAPTLSVTLVDSAEAVTADLAALTGPAPGAGKRDLYVTDLPDRFSTVASTFWPGQLPTIQHVDL